MKYYRKQPVEAIQWTGEYGVLGWINKFGIEAYMDYEGHPDIDSLDLHLIYFDDKKRKHKATVPMYAWVVVEGKTLQFYKDETFRKTFKAAEEDEDEEASKDDAIKWREEFLKQLHENIEHIIKETRNGGFLYSSSKEDVHAVTGESLCKSSDKETFESVLDEMKELHTKKNKDYNESFHNLFKEYGMSYALGHIEEKLNRVKAIIANGGNAVKNEHIEDSLIDGACYNILTLIELRNRKH